MTVNFTKDKFNLREKLKELERPSADKLVTKDNNGSVYIDTISGNTKLEGIDSIISDTAVDVFVYDTSKDSDGGAWRKRTQHTSWYNEELNTATRGSRREFPAVAVLVLEGTKLTIYDGDDPDLPMWMVFDRASSAGWTPNDTNILGVSYSTFTSISMLNGIFAMGADYASDENNGVLIKVSFVEDTGYFHSVKSVSSSYPAGGFGRYRGSISERDSDNGHININDTDKIVNVHVNDVAMTVLPNAPIDPSTGLPVPTIAVATDGGTSVIKDDGTIVDFNDSSFSRPVSNVAIKGNDIVHWNINNGTIQQFFNALNATADSLDEVRYNYTHNGGHSSSQNVSALLRSSGDGPFQIVTRSPKSISAGAQSGLSIFEEGNDRTFTSTASIFDSRVAYITSDYNTGWMHGDIKGAFLSDTDATDASPGSNLIPSSSADFSSSTGWTLGSGWTISGGKLNKTNTSNVTASYSFTGLTIGKAYTFSIDVETVGSGTLFFYALGQYTIWPSLTTTGTHSLTVVANATSLDFGITAISGNGAVLDNASLTVGEADRSVSSKGLQVFGTVAKSPVATGADLVGYSGFSATNKLENRSDYDFGTGASTSMCIIGWFKTTDISTYTYIMSVFDSGTNHVAGLAINSSSSSAPNTGGTLYVYDSITNQLSGTTLVNDGQWHCAVGIFDGPTRKIYLDGKLEVSNTFTSYSLDIADTDKLTVGRYAYNDTFHFPGSLALTRISKSIPSPEQIKKIYEDEKVLFQKNAKCTLYGSSDAVTALAYDEKTELLHVGTSSGRSDFQGLRRINNTTTAVTTAISASKGLVAEQ